MKKVFLGFLIIFSFIFAEDKYYNGKILSLQKVVLNNGEEDESVKETRYYKVKILNGERKGKIYTIPHPIYKEKAYNINIKKGKKVVILEEEIEEGEENKEIPLYIVDVEKRGAMSSLIVIFSLLTFFIAKKRGIKALLSLFIVVTIVYKIFLPMIANGYSPILVASFCALLSSGVTIGLTTGLSKKGYVAILGAISGVICAGALSMYFSYRMGLTGFDSVDSMNLSQLLAKVKVKEIVSAGVILGSMGAVMDVAISIASAMKEVIDANPKISRRGVFKAGMRVGADIIGSMVNTLILAYIGSGILSTLFIYLQKEQFPAIRILNFETIASDILRAFAGSIGILVTVPMTAYLSSRYLKNKKEKGKKDVNNI